MIYFYPPAYSSQHLLAKKDKLKKIEIIFLFTLIFKKTTPYFNKFHKKDANVKKTPFDVKNAAKAFVG